MGNFDEGLIYFLRKVFNTRKYFLVGFSILLAFHYLTDGYKEDVDKVINNALFESDNDEMIIVKDIEVYSLCEHHLLPFYGKCHVG